MTTTREDTTVSCCMIPEGKAHKLWCPDQAHARTDDPSTSHEAAATVDVRASQAKVLRLLEEGPATDEELAMRAYRRGVKMTPSGLRSRRAELVAKGLAEPTGDTKLTSSRRRTMVWRAVRPS